MFEIKEFKMSQVTDTKSNPDYMVRQSDTKRVMGFGSLEECKIMCAALNNAYYPKQIFNNGMLSLLRNED